jgi:hypothetical protein
MKYYSNDQIKKNEMGRTRSTNGTDAQKFGQRKQMGRDAWKNYLLKKSDVWV